MFKELSFSDRYQGLIEAFVPGLVTTTQHDRLACRIEGKKDTIRPASVLNLVWLSPIFSPARHLSSIRLIGALRDQ